jgi:hypothetical protein
VNPYLVCFRVGKQGTFMLTVDADSEQKARETARYRMAKQFTDTAHRAATITRVKEVSSWLLA